MDHYSLDIVVGDRQYHYQLRSEPNHGYAMNILARGDIDIPLEIGVLDERDEAIKALLTIAEDLA
jgi:hypothetical protein